MSCGPVGSDFPAANRAEKQVVSLQTVLSFPPRPKQEITDVELKERKRKREGRRC